MARRTAVQVARAARARPPVPVVDGRHFGNHARFIRHSAAPTCQLGYPPTHAIQPIVCAGPRGLKCGEELTLEYPCPAAEACARDATRVGAGADVWAGVQFTHSVLHGTDWPRLHAELRSVIALDPRSAKRALYHVRVANGADGPRLVATRAFRPGARVLPFAGVSCARCLSRPRRICAYLWVPPVAPLAMMARGR